MTKKTIIPIHNFSKDNETSEPFQMIAMHTKTAYDISVPHRHNYYEIFLFEKGGGVHDIDFQTNNIEDRSIHFVSPGQVHKVRSELNTCGHIILFSRDFFYGNNGERNDLFKMPFLNNNCAEPVINLNTGDYSKILILLEAMKEEYNNKQDLSKEVIQSYLNLVLLICKRLFDKRIEDVDIYNSTFQNFRELLENEFDKKHQVSSYASHLGISDKQLSIVTNKVVGKKALEMIHDRIILEAKRLLKYSDHSIKEISFFLNFDDPSHFGKFFKTKESLTPNEYRNANN